MSGQIIPTPAYKAGEWYNFTTLVEKQRLGFIALSLTNYDNNSVPQIAAGSVVEISGSLFKFDSNDSIGGTPTSGQLNYIMLEVSGSGDQQTVSGSWTTTVPTWNDTKQGWYDATGNKIYVGGCYYDGTNYITKFIYVGRALKEYIARYHMISFAVGESVPITDLAVTGKSIQVTANLASFYLPFDVPDGNGSVITQLYGYINAGNGIVMINLCRAAKDSTTEEQMAQIIKTGGTAGEVTDETINNPTIDYVNYKYWFCLTVTGYNSPVTIYSLRIKYLMLKTLS